MNHIHVVIVTCLLLWLSHNCGGKLILHNTLDSLEAILWSKVGPGFSISGKNLVFIASNDTYGKAVGTIGDTRLQIPPEKFFGQSEPRRGTIAMRLRKNKQQLRGPDSPLLGLVGFTPHLHDDGGYDAVCIQWLGDHDEEVGGPSLVMMLMDRLQQTFYCTDTRFDEVDESQWMNISFVWDLDNIPGYRTSERMMIKRNGVTVCIGWADNAMRMPLYGKSNVYVLANYNLNSSSEPLVFLDEIKVWDEAMDCSSGDLECTPFAKEMWPPTNSQLLAYSFLVCFSIIGIAYVVWKFRSEPQLCYKASYVLPEDLLKRVKPQTEYELGDITNADVEQSDDSSRSSDHEDVWEGIENAFNNSIESDESTDFETEPSAPLIK